MVVADRDAPRLNLTFREYAEARSFVVDPARVRHPQDKGRADGGVQYVQTSFFAGETFLTLAQARGAAERWCRVTAGERIHGTTRQRPREHFEREERHLLLPPPESVFEVAPWSEPRVQRDHHVTVAKAATVFSTAYIGQRVMARNGRDLVWIYHRGQLIKVHPRVGPVSAAPIRRTTHRACASWRAGIRKLSSAKLARLAPPSASMPSVSWKAPQPVDACVMSIGRLGPVRRDAAPSAVEQACGRALKVDVVDVTRVARMLEQAVEKESLLQPRPGAGAPVHGQLRFLRQASEYRLARGGDHE